MAASSSPSKVAAVPRAAAKIAAKSPDKLATTAHASSSNAAKPIFASQSGSKQAGTTNTGRPAPTGTPLPTGTKAPAGTPTPKATPAPVGDGAAALAKPAPRTPAAPTGSAAPDSCAAAPVTSALEAVGGALMVGTGAAIGVTGVGAFVGVPMIAYGAGMIGHGLKNGIEGDRTDGFFSQALRTIPGVSRDAANRTDAGVQLGAGLIGAGGAIKTMWSAAPKLAKAGTAVGTALGIDQLQAGGQYVLDGNDKAQPKSAQIVQKIGETAGFDISPEAADNAIFAASLAIPGGYGIAKAAGQGAAAVGRAGFPSDSATLAAGDKVAGGDAARLPSTPGEIAPARDRSDVPKSEAELAGSTKSAQPAAAIDPRMFETATNPIRSELVKPLNLVEDANRLDEASDQTFVAKLNEQDEPDNAGIRDTHREAASHEFQLKSSLRRGIGERVESEVGRNIFPDEHAVDASLGRVIKDGTKASEGGREKIAEAVEDLRDFWESGPTFDKLSSDLMQVEYDLPAIRHTVDGRGDPYEARMEPRTIANYRPMDVSNELERVHRNFGQYGLSKEQFASLHIQRLVERLKETGVPISDRSMNILEKGRRKYIEEGNPWRNYGMVAGR